MFIASSVVDPFSVPSEKTALKGPSTRTGSPTGNTFLLYSVLTLGLCIPHSFNVRNYSFFLLFSSLDGDLFDEAMDGGQVNVNGRGESSPEPFDLSRLGESLAAPSPRKCRTPEAFLGPTGASLVNLDRLIPANPPAKTTNPFLSGIRWIRWLYTHFVFAGKVQENVCFGSWNSRFR